MAEIQNIDIEGFNIKKSKLLYSLHIVVPFGLMILSSITMILSYLQTGTSNTKLQVNYNNQTLYTYNVSNDLAEKDKIIELLNLNNKADQEILINIINTLNFLFSILSVIYSKMMNNESHNLGNDNIKLKSEKNILLEQITNITSTLSLPVTTREFNPIVFNDLSVQHERIPSLTSDMTQISDESVVNIIQAEQVLNTEKNESVLNTGRSDSTVYMQPYKHEPFN
jgi:hypothetical protein